MTENWSNVTHIALRVGVLSCQGKKALLEMLFAVGTERF